MIELSIVILSKTDSVMSYETTMNCIESLWETLGENHQNNYEIILVESNPNYKKEFSYPNYVKVIVPKVQFGFHKFLNFGIKKSKGNFIALCNNDLLFKKDWFNEIISVAHKNPSIGSFSPIDPRKELNKFRGDYQIGYKVTQQVKGWCIVVKNEVLLKIKLLDENFKFYYSDNDYALSLLYYNIEHAVVTKSYVEHLHKISTNESKKNKDSFFKENISNLKIPKHLYHKNLKWILSDSRVLFDHLTYYNKWGDPNSTYRIVRYSKTLNKLHLNYITRLLFLLKRIFKI